jgi:hypothetical protein
MRRALPTHSKPDDIHVVPNFGKPHDPTSACWCRPEPLRDTLDRAKYAYTVWVHQVQQ